MIIHTLKLLIFFAVSYSQMIIGSEVPAVSAGTLVTHQQFQSTHVIARDIYVWLPEGYTENSLYDVLYMHDGQALFDAKKTWNGQEWGVDETASKLISNGKVRPFIVVAITNTERRHSEYFPEEPWLSLSPAQRYDLLSRHRYGGNRIFEADIQSDAYLRFLVDELKPFIDQTYSVDSSREHTFIMGSSMGGLISIYAVSEYPEIFAGAACLSTHWAGIFDMQNNPIPAALNDYLQARLPTPGRHKIYFDHGTKGLDALYPPLQVEVDKIMIAKGYSDQDWSTIIQAGANHSENAWRDRLDLPLLFLLGK